MIDHVSIPVSDLDASAAFYDAVLQPLGFARMIEREGTIGYGKRYPEFWLNQRTRAQGGRAAPGWHVCLRATDQQAVHEFHQTALASGGTDDGVPGPRPHYNQCYYAAFVRDPDGNRIEAVTFI